MFDQPRKGKDQSALKLVEIEKKLQAKNEVLAELMEEHIRLKKSVGVI